MLIKKIPITKVNPAAYNPRKGLKPDDSEYQKLLSSMDEFGYIDPLVWNRKTGNLVGGHQRLGILRAKGLKEIDVSVVNLSPAKEKALNVALNKISGDWDQDKLAALLDELCKSPDIDVTLTGFELPEIEDMLASSLDHDTDEEFDFESELEKDQPVITEPGDLIELGSEGQNRLLCGDATNSSDLTTLLGSHRCQLCHTDPPYNVNYNPNNRPVVQKTQNNHFRITNDNLTPKKYRTWFNKIVASLNESLVPGAACYIWNSHRNFGLMHDLLSEQHFKISSVITWAKESFSPNFSDFNEQTEFCLYGWKAGAKHKWYGPKNETTLWKINRDRTTSYRHPTQKAIELAERAIRNSSQVRDIVFDPFLGSGTTLIAAARLGRRCFGLEIEPKYCDVIVRRFIATAGKDSVSKEILNRYFIERK